MLPRSHRTACAGALIGAALTLGACLGDAERGNPLDPLSDNFRDAGDVAGAVVRMSAPSDGIAGARVTLTPAAGGQALVSAAGADGRFAFQAVPAGSYFAVAEAEGFSLDTATVDVAAGRVSSEITFALNALPRITAQSVRSERINRHFPEPETFSQIVIEATVVEPDGAADLVAVDFIIPSFDDPETLLFRDSLLAVPNSGNLFRRVILEESLPVSIQDLLGRNLFIEARDRSGAVARGSDTHVVRIVEAIPVYTFPQSNDIVTVPFALQWEPLSLPYLFTWRIELFFVPAPGLEQPLPPVTGIPSSQTELMITNALPEGNYAWRVSAVDEFGNSARSREAGFRLDVP